MQDPDTNPNVTKRDPQSDEMHWSVPVFLFGGGILALVVVVCLYITSLQGFSNVFWVFVALHPFLLIVSITVGIYAACYTCRVRPSSALATCVWYLMLACSVGGAIELLNLVVCFALPEFWTTIGAFYHIAFCVFWGFSCLVGMLTALFHSWKVFLMMLGSTVCFAVGLLSFFIAVEICASC